MKAKADKTKPREQGHDAEKGKFTDTEAAGKRPFMWAAIGTAALAIALSALYVLPMPSRLGSVGFPTDGAYIHLTYAHNLAENGTYAYDRSAVATSGSTSPAYVFLIAALHLLTLGEVKSALLIGALSFAASGVFLLLIAAKLFETKSWWVALPTVLFLCMPRMAGTSAAGMGTMLYTACSLAAVYFFLVRRTGAAVVLIAVALWVRPDALVLASAFLLHSLYHRRIHVSGAMARDRQVSAGWALLPWAGGILVAIGYVVFNLVLNGTVFPNSLAARVAAAQAAGDQPFLRALLAYYESPQSAVLFPFTVLGLILAVVQVVKKRPCPTLFAVLALLGTIVAYGLLLPMLPDDGRYLTPTYPFFLLIAIWAMRETFALLGLILPIAKAERWAFGLLVVACGAALAAGLAVWERTRADYYASVRYVLDRHVTGAQWVRSYTPPGSKVATVLPGTFGYYGNRPLVDLTGTVSPQVTPAVGFPAKLEAVLSAENADYLATFRERLEAVNLNPVFTTNPRIPEVLEIFRIERHKIHLVPKAASVLNTRAAYFMSRKLYGDALAEIRRSLVIDPNSARTHTLAGICLLETGDTAQAKTFLERALEIQEDYAPAMVPLGDIHASRKEYTTALRLLENAMRLNPDSPTVRTSYNRTYEAYMRDSLKASGFRFMKFRER
ncbi:MAG: hypothetical protein QHI48_01805 [Bacteroidota bacterium]|nr:hypothetical protein [Bacteroidota bacterium]